MPLTDKQQRFVEEYVIDFNAAAAARRAGYSERTAKEMGAENLTKPHIASEIATRMATLSAQTRMTAAEAWQEVTHLARSDISQFLDITGATPKMKPANQIPLSAWKACKSIKAKRYTEGHGEDAQEVEVIEYMLWPKLDAAALILKGHGELVEQIQHTGHIDTTVPLTAEEQANIVGAMMDKVMAMREEGTDENVEGNESGGASGTDAELPSVVPPGPEPDGGGQGDGA